MGSKRANCKKLHSKMIRERQMYLNFQKHTNIINIKALELKGFLNKIQKFYRITYSSRDYEISPFIIELTDPIHKIYIKM